MATDLNGRLHAVDDSQEVEVFVGGDGFLSKISAASQEEYDPFINVKSVDGINSSQKRKIARIEKAYQGTTGTSSKSRIEESLITGYALFDVAHPEVNLEYLAQLYTKSSPHFAAVRAKVSNIVGLGFDFLNSESLKQKIDATTDASGLDKIRRNTEKKRSEVFNYIDDLNVEDTFLETMAKMYTDYESLGNGYVEVGRTVDGVIGYLGHIPSKTMRVRKNRDGFVQIVNDKARFFRNFGDKNTPDPIDGDTNPNEVIHFKKYSPTDSYYGIPDIMAAMDAVLGNELASRYNLDYFDNKAVPRYVIVMKSSQKFSVDSQRKIAEFFDKNLRGSNHRSLFIPLPADDENVKSSFEMKPVEAGTQDSSFSNYDKKNLNQILMVHRVPISKIGLAEGVSLASARDSDKTFAEQVCRPEQRIIEKKLGRIFKEITDMFRFKLTELKLSDEDTQSKIDERYLRWGVKVANDIRQERGQPTVPWGDKQAYMATDPKAGASSNTSSATTSGQKATAGATRTRDAQRSSGATDTNGTGRATQGAGRTTP